MPGSRVPFSILHIFIKLFRRCFFHALSFFRCLCNQSSWWHKNVWVFHNKCSSSLQKPWPSLCFSTHWLIISNPQGKKVGKPPVWGGLYCRGKTVEGNQRLHASVAHCVSHNGIDLCAYLCHRCQFCDKALIGLYKPWRLSSTWIMLYMNGLLCQKINFRLIRFHQVVHVKFLSGHPMRYTHARHCQLKNSRKKIRLEDGAMGVCYLERIVKRSLVVRELGLVRQGKGWESWTFLIWTLLSRCTHWTGRRQITLSSPQTSTVWLWSYIRSLQSTHRRTTGGMCFPSLLYKFRWIHDIFKFAGVYHCAAVVVD